MSSLPGGVGGGAGSPAARGPTASELLKIRWDYVVATVEAPVADGTAVKVARSALPIAEAFKRMAGTDPRPLLVLRECQVCNKTDNALLRPGADNERTIVLSNWFHCVKLPVDVIESDQPFNALFPTNDAEHLFVCAPDGSSRIPLESDTSRPALWSAMGKVLASSYQKDTTSAAKEIQRAYDELDRLDDRLATLAASRDDLAEKPGRMDKDKAKKLEREIEVVKKDLDEQRRTIDRLAKIELKPARKA